MQTSKNYQPQLDHATADDGREAFANTFSLIQVLRDINHGSDLTQDCPN